MEPRRFVWATVPSGALSPDGAWMISIVRAASDPQIVLLPTSVGEPRALSKEGLAAIDAAWLPDGKRILFSATEPGHGTRVYIRDVGGGKPRALTPEGYFAYRGAISPDSKVVVARGPDRRIYLYPVEGGEPTPLAGLSVEDVPIRFTPDGRTLFLQRRGQLPAAIFRYDVASGRKEPWKELMPSDAAGLNNINRVVVTPDGTGVRLQLRSDSFLPPTRRWDEVRLGLSAARFAGRPKGEGKSHLDSLPRNVT